MNTPIGGRTTVDRCMVLVRVAVSTVLDTGSTVGLSPLDEREWLALDSLVVSTWLPDKQPPITGIAHRSLWESLAEPGH